jgi:hypothetical protein
MEVLQALAGKTITVSFWVKGTSGKSVSASFSQNFGSGGSTAVDTNLDSLVLNGSWQKYEETATLGALAGKTLGTDPHVSLYLNVPLNDTYTIDFTAIQVELGNEATGFEFRDFELEMVSRYYQKSYDADTAPGSSTTTAMQNMAMTVGTGSVSDKVRTFVELPVRMRAVPTMRYWDSAGAINRVRVDATNGKTPSSGTPVTNPGFRGFEPSMNFDAVDAGVRCAWHWDADAEL